MTAATLPLAHLQTGGKQAIAAALALIDHTHDTHAADGLLHEAYLSPRAGVVGLTGPPGVGKSTLANSLIKAWRGRALTVGVIAVDPSSQISRGALLGDRIRMRADPDDDGVFIRSLASRGQLGGLSEIAFPVIVLMRAIYDRVIIESVGVGQSEADIASVADTVLLCVQPGSGDAMQFMKAGIMEIPHIAAVTKADMGQQASRALAELKGAISLAASSQAGWETRCLMLSAQHDSNIETLMAHIDAHSHHLQTNAFMGEKRQVQAQTWLRSAIAAEFGRQGAALLQHDTTLRPGESPFRKRRELVSRLRLSLI